MNNNSWVKLHIKFLSWEWYKDSNTKSVFIHCLLKANWKDGKFEGYDIPKGSFVTSVRKLSEELKLSTQCIRTSLKKLEKTKNLTIKTTNKFSIITVNNYDIYQSVTNDQQTTNKQLTTIEEYKNNRIKKEKINKKEKKFFNVPEWFNKSIEKEELTDNEKQEIENLLEEFK